MSEQSVPERARALTDEQYRQAHELAQAAPPLTSATRAELRRVFGTVPEIDDEPGRAS